MAKPVILIVDDEAQVLNAIERDLRKHFRGEYRIVKSDSGQNALETVKTLKRRNDAVAVLISDQRMPLMSGTEFLTEAQELYPDSCKVLLTAYAETEAAITSINKIGLDHYLMKPWDPPDKHLYPVLDELLDDWKANVRLPYDGIRVAGTLWSAESYNAKDFLARNGIPYQWLDIEKSAEARLLVEAVAPELKRVPIVFFPDGSIMIEPDHQTLARKIGLKTEAGQDFYDLIVVGGGPAGLAAAVYGGSEGLQTMLIEKEATGGQAGTSSIIENYLGFPKGITGGDLARRATEQAKRFGVEIISPCEVTGARVEGPYRFVATDDGSELSCHALLITAGVSTRTLSAPGMEKLTGRGVYYGASLGEAPFYNDQDVFVVGRGNSAAETAMYFARYAKKVRMLVRGDSLKPAMSQFLIDQVAAVENIEVLLKTQVKEVHGKERLESVTLINSETGKTETLSAGGLFVFIGMKPHTDFMADLVLRNEGDFILTGADLMQDQNGHRRPKGWTEDRDPLPFETSVPGIFAAGDVRFGSIKRVAAAVGEGSTSVRLIHEYLKTV